MKIAIIAILLFSAILAVSADNDHHDNNSPRSNRCKFTDPDFIRHNTAMLDSLAGSRSALPTQMWEQSSHYIVQLPTKNWAEVAAFNFYQYNYWDQARCTFVAEHYNFVVKADGSYGIMIEEVDADPIKTGYILGGEQPVETFQEYNVYWHASTPASFANIGIVTGTTYQASLTDNTISISFLAADRSLLGTHNINIVVPNQDRDYSVFIGGNVVLQIDSTSMDFLPLITAARAAWKSGSSSVYLQPDPMGLQYGIVHNVLIFDIPASSARSDVLETLANNYKNYLQAVTNDV